MLHITDLRVTRGKFKLQIDDLNLSGRSILLIGENGSGKTTLLQSIAGFIQSSGKIYLEDFEINSLPVEKRYVCMLSTTLNIFKDKTVKENLNFPKRKRDGVYDDLINDLGLAEKENVKGAYLSSGEMQRLAIGRCLISESRLMLFDEPFSFQDQINKMLMRDTIEKYSVKFNVPYIITTNIYGEFLYNFHNIVSIWKGMILENVNSMDNISHFRTASLISPLNLLKIKDEYYIVDPNEIVFGDSGYDYEAISSNILRIKIDGNFFYLKTSAPPNGNKLNFGKIRKLQY